MGKLKIILVRHGESEANKQGVFSGQVDVPLTEKGKEQAARASQLLMEEEITAVYSSDLMRAKDTASIILKHHDAEISLIKDLREMHFGCWEGLTFKEILSEYSEIAKDWMEDYIHYPCLEGESMLDMYSRVVPAYEQIVERHKDQDGTVLIVAHAGVIQSILAHVIVGEIGGCWKFKVDNCSLTMLEYDQSMQGERYGFLTVLNRV